MSDSLISKQVDIITNGGLDDDEYASVKMLLSTITIHSAQQLGAIALGRQKNKRMQTSSEATQDDSNTHFDYFFVLYIQVLTIAIIVVLAARLLISWRTGDAAL